MKARIALVTGAGSPDGIGFATARALASAGHRVAITYRSGPPEPGTLPAGA